MKHPEQRSISFQRLRHRSEFVAAAKGARARREAFGLQACERSNASAQAVDGVDAPRFGLTVTKRTAQRAVDRNRMRRRLRAALRAGVALSGETRHDYVIVGREGLLTIPFNDLQHALNGALAEVRRKLLGRGRTKTVSSAREAGA